MFTKRTTKPEKSNKYYILASAGGYAKGIAGSKGGSSVLPNCAGYAACRFNESLQTGCMKYFAYWPDAENFYDIGKQQGLPVGEKPVAGSIIVWRRGKTWYNADGAGHVEFVEEVKSDGSIITSASAWGGEEFYVMHRYRESGNWGMGSAYAFVGFVYPPSSANSRCIKKGDKGADVELMQARLHALGYLRKDEIDGDFGKITLGALLAFQFENKLEVDGICGPSTQAALAK